MGLSLLNRAAMGSRLFSLLVFSSVISIGIADVSPGSKVVCGQIGNGIIDLSRVDNFHWTSPGRNDEAYFKECEVNFVLPRKHDLKIYIHQFHINGDYSNGCLDGDYVQFSLMGNHTEKLCGRFSKLRDWPRDDYRCTEDWCWPYQFTIHGSPISDTMVTPLFRSDDPKHRRYGFDLKIALGRQWKTPQAPPTYQLKDVILPIH